MEQKDLIVLIFILVAVIAGLLHMNAQTHSALKAVKNRLGEKTFSWLLKGGK